MRKPLILLTGIGSAYLGVTAAFLIAKPSDKMERPTFNCSTDQECYELAPCKLKQEAFLEGRLSAAKGCDGGPDTQPYRLVGYECVGATGPLYRDEEDEFPRCGEIKGIWE